MPSFSLLESFTGANLSLPEMVLFFALSFGFGVVISFVYKVTQKGISYDGSFAFTLVLITMIINAIMVTIGSNIALSLGLIGSLSVIRFRTAIKNSLDMAFLFWAIATGLALGARQLPVAISVIIFIGLVVILLGRSRFFSSSNTDYILTVSLDDVHFGDAVTNIFDSHHVRWKKKSSFVNKESGAELTFTLSRLENAGIQALLNDLDKISGVKQLNLLSPESQVFL